MAIGFVIFIVIIGFIIRCGYALEKAKNEKSEFEKANDAVDAAIKKEDRQTRNLLMKTLEDIGCQYEIDDNDSIIFKYQGEKFNIDVSNDSPAIWIYNIAWTGIKTNNTDADFLKQAINKANENSAYTNLYTIYEEVIFAHCQIMIYFAYNIPNYREYLKSTLDGFFMAHQQVRFEFAKLSKIQEQKEKVEIKGFRSN